MARRFVIATHGTPIIGDLAVDNSGYVPLIARGCMDGRLCPALFDHRLSSPTVLSNEPTVEMRRVGNN